MPRSAIPVTTTPIRRSVPVGSHTQPPVGPVAGSVHPSRPGAPNIRPRAPPATAPGVFHITRKVRYLDATRVGGGPSRGCSYPLKKTLGIPEQLLRLR
ncbi:hypothetical protein Tco_1507066 [Tanacetum coccineum]